MQAGVASCCLNGGRLFPKIKKLLSEKTESLLSLVFVIILAGEPWQIAFNASRHAKPQTQTLVNHYSVVQLDSSTAGCHNSSYKYITFLNLKPSLLQQRADYYGVQNIW